MLLGAREVLSLPLMHNCCRQRSNSLSCNQLVANDSLWWRQRSVEINILSKVCVFRQDFLHDETGKDGLRFSLQVLLKYIIHVLPSKVSFAPGKDTLMQQISGVLTCTDQLPVSSSLLWILLEQPLLLFRASACPKVRSYLRCPFCFFL